RKELGKTEYLAWCDTRPDGGRGFGFTGGHSHWLWGNPDYRKLLLNGIVWTAGVDVPNDGVDVPTPSWETLEKNQEFEPNLSPEQIQQWQERISNWNK
ncbi:MAG: hypothetical protein FWC50_02395, partial [Planctomycetaceae bacterium]|nr:hypothetical protein [Planctomycetaceae bacterium]